MSPHPRPRNCFRLHLLSCGTARSRSSWSAAPMTGTGSCPGGRIEVGESASTAVTREVCEEAGVAITVTGLAGIYSDPAHVLVYPHEEVVYQQFTVCFHAISTAGHAEPDDQETTAAAWFEPEQAVLLSMHPAMRQRLTDALTEPHQAHFD
jgi:ADP-ribose pyrophosphatase YjhB (NUDIX family)